jgi:hypothetical protein
MFKPLTLRSLLLTATMLVVPAIAMAQMPAQTQQGCGVSAQLAPPALPVYAQPPMPAAGYIWTPGYWNWGQPVGYYWVPGTWVQPPEVNVLWTPPYWGWDAGVYLFHDGYWGPHVGYYGGVNYGFGYGGDGYGGGRWQNGAFAYNRTVNNFGSVHIQNEYSADVAIVNNNHVSYYGGAGGLRTEPSAEQRTAEAERHVPMTAEQNLHVSVSARTPDMAASHNGGRPAIVATARPGQFEGEGVVRSPPAGNGEHPGTAQVSERPAANAEVRPAEHAVAEPIAHEPARPPAPGPERTAEHAVAAPPVQHAVARPAETHPAAVRVEAPHPAPAHEAEHKEDKQ